VSGTESKFPVKVDIGAKAEAKLEVRAEIPTQSAGRLVDALADIISPFSERRGLKGDQLRLQRVDTAIAIARRSLELTALQGITPSPIPNKILGPLIEKASLEDPDSELIEWWARIISSASASKTNQIPIFSNFLSSIDFYDAKFIEQIFNYVDTSLFFLKGVNLLEILSKTCGNDLDKAVADRDHGAGIFDKDINEKRKVASAAFSDRLKLIIPNFVNETAKYGIFITELNIPVSNIYGSFYIDSLFMDSGRYELEIVSVLCSIGILEYHNTVIRYNLGYVGDNEFYIRMFRFTEIGKRFARICVNMKDSV
jgi:hypothetical protein